MNGISLGFVLIAILILWFIIGSKGHWLSKAAIILFSLYFCLSVGFSVKSFMGWPTSEELPEQFFVHWIVIDEPDAKVGDEGNVYIWVRPISETKKEYNSWRDYLFSFYDGNSQPRAYARSYDRDLHEKAQEAIDMIKSGENVGGVNLEDAGGESSGDAGKGESEKEGGANATGNEGGTSLTNNGGIMFHKLPPPRLPDK